MFSIETIKTSPLRAKWQRPAFNNTPAVSITAITVRRALPWPPNKHFLQVSQSGYANLIDRHASLQSLQSTKPNRFSRTIVNKMSEVYTWLKSLPGGLGLEKCCRVFESRGFLTLSSLKYLRPGDIDAFFPSLEKLLLAEKRILESEIKGIVDPESRRTPLRPLELSQRFNSHIDTWQSYYASSSSYQTAPSHQSLPPNILPTTTAACNTAEGPIAGGHEIKPLDRKRGEMKENLLVLHVQITSASGQLQKLKAEQQEFTSLAAIRGRICNRCHGSGHTKTTCKYSPSGKYQHLQDP